MKPISEFVIQKGFISRNELAQIKSDANNQKLARDKLSEHCERFRRKSPFHGSRGTHCDTVYRLTSKLKGKLDTLPKFEPVRRVEHIISMLNKQASGGHPYYKRKGLLLDVVKKVMNDISKESVDPEIFARPAVIHRALQPGDDSIKNR
jgi:hypothetical protein